MKPKKLNILVPAEAARLLPDDSQMAPICFTILGLLSRKPALPYTYVVDVCNDHSHRTSKRKVTTLQVRKAFQYLLDKGIIIIERLYDKCGIPNLYAFSEEYIRLRANSQRFYKSYRDLRSRKNVIKPNHYSVSDYYPSVDVKITNYSEWMTMSDKITPECRFIQGLDEITSLPMIFDYLEAQAYSLKNMLTILPNYFPNIPFNVIYRPTRTGRLIAYPHIYCQKEYRQFLKPATDPGLLRGCLFGLDYNAQELRMLGNECKNGDLKRICNRENVWPELIKLFDVGSLDNRILPEDHKAIVKQIVYANVYGSIGDGPTKKIAKILHKSSIYRTYKDIGTFVKQNIKHFKNCFPEVGDYSDELVRNYKADPSVYRLPGGLLYNPKPNTCKDGTERKKPLRSTLLNYTIQSTGSLILRNIIAQSDRLKYCRIFYPIHDACVFYVPHKEDYQKAYEEARQLMLDCSTQVAPNVIMPVKQDFALGLPN